MSLKFKLLAATATLALSVSSVSANEVNFVQSSNSTDSTIASIVKSNILQTTGSKNYIGRGFSDKFTVVGSLKNLNIKQNGTGNIADMDVYTSNDGIGTIDMDFTGDSNDFDMVYGASGDTSFSTIDIDVDVDGSGNTFKEVIAQTATSFAYNAKVTGSTNAIDTTSGTNVTTLDIDYDIVGSNNFLTVDTGASAGGRDLDIDINGNGNNWTVNAYASTSSTVDVKQTAGENVTGIIEQLGVSSNMNLDLAAASSGAFAIYTSDSSTGSSATINLTTLGKGAFDIYQTTNNSVYNVSMTVAVEGDIDVNM